MQWLLVAVLGGWLIASAINQLPHRFRPSLSQWDPLGLLPAWSFFAPTPGTSDYRLAIRDIEGSDGWTAWREVEMYAPPIWIRAVWNPGKLETKALFDLVGLMLSRNRPENWNRLVCVSWPYLVLLRRAMGEPVAPRATARQFGILSSTGFGPDRAVAPLFVSATHRFC